MLGCVLALLIVLARERTPTAAALLAGGAAVALAGWLDDRFSASVTLRLFLHAAAAITLVTTIGLPSIGVTRAGPELIATAVAVSAIVGLMWLVNLMNFMDGIDGIATTQSTISGFNIGLLLWPSDPGLGAVALSLAGGAAGFAVWNLPPARIFMGDVGSGFLGFLIGALAIAGWSLHGVSLVALLLPTGPFIADASMTLLRRLARRERLHLAHRKHLYQRLTIAGWSHGAVTSVYASTALALACIGQFGAANAWSPVAMASTGVAILVGLGTFLEGKVSGV